ncbi:WhiB family transcriptional regulator [Streptomyces griseoviridis]|uniref:WhiB family transcriptional regulator n=1 Tax=Streptomyces griseoviridis TaxID=45398 RepID=UPI003F540DA1
MRPRTSHDAPNNLDRPPHWDDSAACKASDEPDYWFAEGSDASAIAQRHEAKRVCGSCPCRTSCLHAALERGESSGVWGGLDVNERAALTLLPSARDPGKEAADAPNAIVDEDEEVPAGEEGGQAPEDAATA